MRTFSIMLVTSIAMVLCGFATWPATPVSAPPTSHPQSQPASQPSTQPANQPKEKITIAGEEFTLELAADDEAREKGLMGRDHIDRHAGMLFIWPKSARQEFWMKNCPIDIDLLFLDDTGRIIAAHAMKAEAPQASHETNSDYDARLARYDSLKPARFAIELAPGTIDRLKLKAGQTCKAQWRDAMRYTDKVATTSTQPE